ncbi:hypothetical protein EST38_g6664 [Candolleomyces aberdarensis]|uniref:FHA domain-containing protein n=1 Tax=Candolleomyces aberdarensis TaxID=2316362 RepID=A0A4Q2DJA1_9AGAR|nr:hypothetical protein EST38_g6664 [Candolleomyces aberdarensis]
MWLISGPFDGEVVGEVNFQKTKLLKTDRDYKVGRKGTDLLINSKKISAPHGCFAVGKFGAKDIENPSSVPGLTFTSQKKTFKVIRGDNVLDYSIGVSADLQDGDEVALLPGHNIKVHWSKVCCYPSSELEDTSRCGTLGIHVVSQPSPDVTHHLTSEFSASADIATSLISSARFVKPEWLQEVLRLGDPASPGTISPFEENFNLPSVTKYRPGFASTLDPPQKVYNIWEPNEERLHIFKEYRFLCVGEKARPAPLDLRQMLERGDGTYENFDVHLGVDKFRRAVTRGLAKQGKKLVLVGDGGLLAAAVGKDVLRDFVQEATNCNLKISPPESLVQAVLEVDTSKLDPPPPEPSAEEESVAPNTIEQESPIVEEESVPAPPPTRRRLLKRTAASREPSVAPEPQPENPPPPPPKPMMRLKRATRRHQDSDMVTGLDDPSSILDSVPDLDPVPTPMAVEAPVAPTPTKPAKLKRRAKQASTAESNPLESVQETFEIQDSYREPPLKKFKALFDASDPDRLSQTGGLLEEQTGLDEDVFGGMTTGTGSQTQTETQARTHNSSGSSKQSSKRGASLMVLRQEEEESLPMTAESTGVSKKRRLEEVVGDDDDAEIVEASAEGPAKKKRTTTMPPPSSTRSVAGAPAGTPAAGPSSSNARAASKPPSMAPQPFASPSKSKPKAKGADPGKPDKDTAFLKAIASTKRGKKNEDEFDREFNKLKISKPDLNSNDAGEPEKEWAVLAEFGDDTGLRGNFMTILEMEVFKERTDNGQRAGTSTQGKPDWQGKPNFKKFKRKDVHTERPKVALYVNDEDDCGLGSTYWKSGNSQSQTQVKGAASQEAPKSKPKPKSTAKSKRGPTAEPSDGEGNEPEETSPPPPAQRARSQRGASKPPSSSKPASRASSRAGSAAPSTQKRKASATTSRRRQITIVEEDDDDDGEEPLFLPNDDPMTQDMFVDNDGEDDQVSTLRSNGSLERPKAAPKKAATTAKGKAKSAPKKKAMIRDDSDDEAVFKGFGRRK